RRVVRRRDDDAVRELLLSAAIVHEDRTRNDRRRRHAVAALADRFYIVGCQNLECGALGWPGKRVGVLAHVERACALAAPIVANSPCDGRDMAFGEGAAQR